LFGAHHLAQNPILGTTITLERLRKRAYEALLTYYEKFDYQQYLWVRWQVICSNVLNLIFYFEQGTLVIYLAEIIDLFYLWKNQDLKPVN